MLETAFGIYLIWSVLVMCAPDLIPKPQSRIHAAWCLFASGLFGVIAFLFMAPNLMRKNK